MGVGATWGFFVAFALFMGICMSITAFPLLVRILQMRVLRLRLAIATACAAVDDVTAWSILAFVVAIARATSVGAVVNVGLVGASQPSKMVLAVVVGLVLISAWATELIGIHALFGAFLAGVVMPAESGFRDKLIGTG